VRKSFVRHVLEGWRRQQRRRMKWWCRRRKTRWMEEEEEEEVEQEEGEGQSGGEGAERSQGYHQQSCGLFAAAATGEAASRPVHRCT